MLYKLNQIMERSYAAVSIEDCGKRVVDAPRSMLFESARGSERECVRSYFFEHPLEWIEIRTLGGISQAFSTIERASAEGLWVAGYLGYECGYHWEPTAAPLFQASNDLPLGAFGVYGASVEPSRRAGTEVTCGLTDVSLSLSSAQFQENFRKIQQWVSDGDTYQVNLTCKIEAAFAQSPDVLFAHMMRNQPVEFGAMLNVGGRVILSASPELFFQSRGRELRVRPMKGTSRRGRNPAEDDELAAILATDEKNRAENVMIVDLLRSDIGRIAEMGSVQVEGLFNIERHPSLLQMTSEIRATLREDVSFYELFRALFPSGSIVGAPKVRTMQIIRELEGRDRGVYTGAIGYIAPQRNAVFSVGIRTAVLNKGQFSMGVGAGITVGSNVEAEFEECLLKGEFLRDRSFELIESMRWESGRCELLDLHMERIERSARFFGFPLDVASARLAITDFGNRLSPVGAWKLRMMMKSSGACKVSGHRLEEGTTVALQARLWSAPVPSSDPWLRHKTNRRYLYDKALGIAQEAGCVDALFFNEHGMVTEGAIHSILVRHGTIWRTPPLSAGVLPGVYRRHLLANRFDIREEDIRVDELWNANEIWLMNAVRGLRRVELREEPLAAKTCNPIAAAFL